jgi:hypothetical protein
MEVPMSLGPYPDQATLCEEARDALAQVPVLLNIFKMMANADTLIVPVTRLGGAILSRQKLDAKLRELVILQVAPTSKAGSTNGFSMRRSRLRLAPRRRRLTPSRIRRSIHRL